MPGCCRMMYLQWRILLPNSIYEAKYHYTQMSARPPKYKVVPVLLMVDLAAMAFVGYPRYAAGQMSALQYFGIIAATVAVIVLLFFSLRARYRRGK